MLRSLSHQVPLNCSWYERYGADDTRGWMSLSRCRTPDMTLFRWCIVWTTGGTWAENRYRSSGSARVRGSRLHTHGPRYCRLQRQAGCIYPCLCRSSCAHCAASSCSTVAVCRCVCRSVPWICGTRPSPPCPSCPADDSNVHGG